MLSDTTFHNSNTANPVILNSMGQRKSSELLNILRFIGQMCIIKHGWNFQPLQHIQSIQFDIQNNKVQLRIGI